MNELRPIGVIASKNFPNLYYSIPKQFPSINLILEGPELRITQLLNQRKTAILEKAVHIIGYDLAKAKVAAIISSDPRLEEICSRSLGKYHQPPFIHSLEAVAHLCAERGFKSVGLFFSDKKMNDLCARSLKRLGLRPVRLLNEDQSKISKACRTWPDPHCNFDEEINTIAGQTECDVILTESSWLKNILDKGGHGVPIINSMTVALWRAVEKAGWQFPHAWDK